MEETPILVGNRKIVIYKDMEVEIIGFGKFRPKIATVEYYNKTITKVINHTNEPICINGVRYI